MLLVLNPSLCFFFNQKIEVNLKPVLEPVWCIKYGVASGLTKLNESCVHFFFFLPPFVREILRRGEVKRAPEADLHKLQRIFLNVKL